MIVHSAEYRVRYSEVDRQGLLKLRALFDYAQESAGQHAAQLGFSMEALNARHQTWMLSRIKVRISQYPVAGTTIIVKTWPAGFDRILARREFRFLRGDNQQEIAAATSLWLIADTRTNRLISAESEVGDALPCYTEESIAFAEVGKLPPVHTPEIRRCTARETLLDINQHLNNAEYAGFIQDCLGSGIRPAQFQINFQKALQPEHTVSLQGGVNGNSFAFTGYDDGAVAFTAAGELLTVN